LIILEIILVAIKGVGGKGGKEFFIVVVEERKKLRITT
jgi:hypothetical protein